MLTHLSQPLLPVVVVCGTCTEASDLAPPLKAAGRLDHVVTLPAPDGNERTQLLQAAFQDCLASASFSMVQVCSFTYVRLLHWDPDIALVTMATIVAVCAHIQLSTTCLLNDAW